jgi:hypothetical protein
MGFDYKNVDAEQLKTVSHNLTRHTSQTGMPFAPLFVPPTPLAHHQMPPPITFTRNQAEALQVRATLSIKEQQEALIAQRRREAAGEPIDPRGHSFKEWQTSADKPRSMPQPKSRQASGVHLSVNTSRHEDVIAASRVSNISSFTGASTLTYESAPMGSLAAQQSGGRPGMMPPMQTRNGHLAPTADHRTGLIEREAGERPQYFRPSSGRYEVIPHTARPAVERRSFTGPAGPVHHPGMERPVDPVSPAKRDFLAPFERLYDLLSSTEQTKFMLHDLHQRYEATLATKVKEIGDFKSTTHAATTLLNNLQQSTDSLKDMVRYEISRSAPKPSTSAGGLTNDERQEFEEMKARLQKLEDALAVRGEDTSAPASALTPKSNKRKKSGKDVGAEE